MAADEAVRNTVIMRRFYDEVWNQRRVDAVDQILAPKLVAHYEHRTFHGRIEWAERLLRMMLAGLPDLAVSVEDMVARRDVVVTRWVARGTHRGAFFGVAPSGEPMELRGCSWARLHQGQIVELWSHWDVSYLLHRVVAELETFRGVLNICMYCYKVENAGHEWEPVDSYMHRHFGHSLSHGICPTCFAERSMGG
jgi:steroid delta-isomerase-like uncharacterized protein